MKYICHRINTIDELKKISNEFGVELDLRDNLDGRIYIQHNPFETGEDFEEYLKMYNNGIMILNVKSERIEWKILELLKKYNISDFFFLDSSFPMMYALAKIGENNMAIRVSEYEGIETAVRCSGMAKWVWVDCFSRLPISVEDATLLHNLGYKLCLVSPELQGRNEEIGKYANQISEMKFDAICTKKYNVTTWQNLIK